VKKIKEKMEEILKEKIRLNLKERRAFWDQKSIQLKNSLKLTKQKLNEENTKISYEMVDINQEIKTLEAVIKNSSELASNLIKPVKERERCIENMRNTKSILEYENKLKILLSKIKSEKNNIEHKIKIILEANEYIKYNPSVFDNYRELILAECKDVVNHLNKIYEEKVNFINDKLKKISETNKKNIGNNNEDKEIISNDIKEISISINDLDKTSILIYKLTLDKKQMEKYFEIILEFIVILISQNLIEDIEEKLKPSKKSENLSILQLEEIFKGLTYITESIFIRLVSIIKKRQQIYFKEFNDFNLVFINISIFFCKLEKHLDKYLVLIYKIIDLLVKVDNDGKQLDFICYEITTILSNFEKFKFFITVLQEKIYLYNQEISNLPNNLNNMNNNSNINFSNNLNLQNIHNTNQNIILKNFNHNIIDDITLYKNNLSNFLKKFNSYLYDLGEKYANYEIKFIKSKLLKIFKEETKNFNNILEINLKKIFEEFSMEDNSTIEDFFFVLKLSGERAIETKNTQLCMAIINNIKSILYDELLEIFDYKISTVLVKSEFKNKNYQNDLKYSCKDEPCLGNKNQIANLFLIFCFNSIDDSKNNILVLFDFFKNIIHGSIFNSESFDHKKILLIGNQEEEILNEKIKYFHKSEIDLINHLFSEVDQLETRYDEFLGKKFKLLFEFIHPSIKSTVDILNSANYIVESNKINSVEFVESFSKKFIEETEKNIAQWKNQCSEYCFNKFAMIFCDHVAQFMETILILKKYNTIGIILLEKVILNII